MIYTALLKITYNNVKFKYDKALIILRYSILPDLKIRSGFSMLTMATAKRL